MCRKRPLNERAKGVGVNSRSDDTPTPDESMAMVIGTDTDQPASEIDVQSVHTNSEVCKQ